MIRFTYNHTAMITLVWNQTDAKSQVFFDGKIQKIVSQLGALSTLFFNKQVERLLPLEYLDKLPTFDARAWQVPNLMEAYNCLLWREQDATKNSISLAAQSLYKHKELQHKHSDELQEMIFQRGINWNDYPAFFKRGTYVKRQKNSKIFSRDELENLPPEHSARKNPSLEVVRYAVEPLKLDIVSTYKDKLDVLFGDCK